MSKLSIGRRYNGDIILFEHDEESTVSISMTNAEASWLQKSLAKELPPTCEFVLAELFKEIFSLMVTGQIETLSGILSPEQFSKLIDAFGLTSQIEEKS
jgi:hypothetical protein